MPVRRDGQVSPRGAGKWLIRWFVGRDDKGSRTYRSRTVRGTKKEAEQELREVLRSRSRGTYVEPSKEALASYLRSWLSDVAALTVRPKTLADYRSLLERHVIPSLGEYPLARVQPDAIQALYAQMLRKGLSSRTVRYAHSVLHNALEHGLETGRLARNPSDRVKLPRRERREMQTLSPELAEKFLQAAREDRWLALWFLLATSGVRPGEALGLKWSDVDGDRLRVRRALVQDARGLRLEEPKTEKGRRAVVLPPVTLSVLQRHRTTQLEERLRKGPEYVDQDLIFANRVGGPLDYRTVVRRHFKPLATKVGVPELRPYDLRHTHATLLLRQGEHPKIVAERLGHASTKITMDVYSHVVPDMQQGAAEKIQLLFASSAG